MSCAQRLPDLCSEAGYGAWEQPAGCLGIAAPGYIACKAASLAILDFCEYRGVAMGYATWIFQKRTCCNQGSQLMASRNSTFEICSWVRAKDGLSLSSPSQQLSTVSAAGSGCVDPTQPSCLAGLRMHGAPCWAGRDLLRAVPSSEALSTRSSSLQHLLSQVCHLQVLAYSWSLSPLSFTSIIPKKFLAFLNPFCLLDDPT